MSSFRLSCVLFRRALPTAAPLLRPRVVPNTFVRASPLRSVVRFSSSSSSSSDPSPASSSPPESSTPSSPSSEPSSPSSIQSEPSNSNVLARKLQEPHYQLSFTCVPCDTRSTHVVSKQGYHHGSVLITCPGCSNRHVISDHLNIFGDKKVTVEDLLREKGQGITKGVLDENGDVEFL